MEILRLAGDPERMGEAFGESCRAAIAELYALRLANALDQALRHGGRRANESDLLDLARACWTPTERFDAEGARELTGIARGAGLSREQVLALNGLTDLRDALAWGGPLEALGGCTACIAQRDATRHGRALYAQTWDLASDNAPYVVAVHRVPDDAPETWSVTTVGCLSLIGLNAAGVAVGTTNLRTLDARPGVPYLSLIHRALRCRRAADAIAWIEGAERAGGHAFAVLDAEGTAAAVECTATRAETRRVEGGTHVLTNHCLVPDHAAVEGDTPRASSCARRERMAALLEPARGRIDAALLRGFLADEHGGELAIRRDDFGGISTNAAVVIDPEARSLLACAGLPREDAWSELVGA